MTLEQLKQGNKIQRELERLGHFKGKCVLEKIELITDDDEKLYIRSYPDIIEQIQNCLSNKITELEKQLEEL